MKIIGITEVVVLAAASVAVFAQDVKDIVRQWQSDPPVVNWERDVVIVANHLDPCSVGSLNPVCGRPAGRLMCRYRDRDGVIYDNGFAGQYATKHCIPCEHIAIVGVPVREAISPRDIKGVLDRVFRLNPNPKALVFAWSAPNVLGQ